jgi:hypothetical protein
MPGDLRRAVHGRAVVALSLLERVVIELPGYTFVRYSIRRVCW